MKYWPVAWVLRLFPRSWRVRYGGEVADLTEELVETGATSQPRAVAGLAASAAVERARSLRHPHHILVATGAAVILTCGALAAMTALSSGPTTVAGPTGTINLQNVRGFQAVCEGSCKKVGYANKRDLLVGLVAPVYLRDHKTLVGHIYNGIGFVPLGTSPWSLPCNRGFVSANGTTSTVPCAGTIVVPDVVGMVTPTAVAELSGLGIAVVLYDVHSSTVSPGHIASTSPVAGTTVHREQPVVVDLSVAKSVPVGYGATIK